ncbi:MAG: bifunctional phosphopantothenoylcysteine decarboxylase/phosphopantothenate--cysteine ligase CoaBC [Firmicutes bacterium]|nr:bifunctional phosphopantothenoylcysteine decarboxylase/phosphopantothenate--cysteine ligase CoaBC [Bacillota bacterium]
MTGKTIVVGVTGGIAAYKSCEIVSALKKLGASVHVIMTKSATEFVTPLTFETLSNNRVVCDMFDGNREWNVEHISLAKAADLFLIAPATANIIAKVANGIADDFLSTTIMATECDIVLAPAMNTAMLNNEAYKNNERILRDRGYHFIESESGELACGDRGKGRLASVPTIVGTVFSLLKSVQDYVGKSVLVTAGATKEAIDPVRFLSNKSSGLMGIEIAIDAFDRGAETTLVIGNIKAELEKKIPNGINLIKTTTTDEMHKAIVSEKKQDYYIFAAAPCDYKIDYSKNKIKDKELSLKLIKNIDIAYEIGKAKNKAKTIIFAAESENLIKNAKDKLIIKNADMVVANDITKDGAGFDVDTNIATIITKDKQISTSKIAKKELAKIILTHAQTL